MLLEEVRRLKVAELRAELRERGLDPRGLKAELVTRLLSAIETTQPDHSVELKPLDTQPVHTAEETPVLTCQTESTATGAAAVTVDEQHTLEQNQSGNLEEVWTRPRACVDQSTQTEQDTAAGVSQSVCSCANRREEEEEEEQVKTLTSDVHQHEVQSPPLYTSQQCKSRPHHT